ncbi:hypothetical protein IW261DRAFT_1413245 [Armillaria novae-zelandiae]|uniref:DUF2423 domain-containing protein n=1 Tax=Armillaria novae-zelandiae TaxID=153914 RepID=A0AA39PX84_9AGAR|nr:hypothetical protein IW261DRAFT_1413245 [Armillaria novae-zelandiae]
MAKSLRSKTKRDFRSKKREDGIYAATEAARLHRLNAKLMAVISKDADGDIPLEGAEGEDRRLNRIHKTTIPLCKCYSRVNAWTKRFAEGGVESVERSSYTAKVEGHESARRNSCCKKARSVKTEAVVYVFAIYISFLGVPVGKLRSVRD